jgi:hypothetical protein
MEDQIMEIDFLHFEIGQIDCLNLSNGDRRFIILKESIEDLYPFAFGYYIGGLF